MTLWNTFWKIVLVEIALVGDPLYKALELSLLAHHNLQMIQNKCSVTQAQSILTLWNFLHTQSNEQTNETNKQEENKSGKCIKFNKMQQKHILYQTPRH